MTQSFNIQPQEQVNKSASNNVTIAEFGFSEHKFKDILNNLKKEDREALEDARERMFYSLLSKYRRIFALAKEHCKEKNNDDNFPHLFSVPFSVLDVFLNPSKTRLEDRDNVGCVRYILNHKSVTHKYCILPTTTWALVDHIFKKHPDFKAFIDDEQINPFYKCVNKEVVEIDFDKLTDCYHKAGGLQGIVDKALANEPNDELRQYLQAVNKLLKNKVIEPIETFTGKNKRIPYKVSQYIEALERLNEHSQQRKNVDNELRAFNLAIVSYLTGETMYLDLYYDYSKYLHRYEYSKPVRLICNSRPATMAFKRENNSCCPQFITALVLLKHGLVEGLDYAKLEKKTVYFEKGQECLEKLKKVCYDMSYSMRLTSAKYHCNDAEVVKSCLIAVYDYFSALVYFKKEIFPLINHVMKINLGYADYHKEDVNYSNEKFKTLKDLRQPPLYEEITTLIFKDAYEDAQNAYKYFYEYVCAKGILTQDCGLAEKADKFGMLYNENCTISKAHSDIE